MTLWAFIEVAKLIFWWKYCSNFFYSSKTYIMVFFLHFWYLLLIKSYIAKRTLNFRIFTIFALNHKGNSLRIWGPKSWKSENRVYVSRCNFWLKADIRNVKKPFCRFSRNKKSLKNIFIKKLILATSMKAQNVKISKFPKFHDFQFCFLKNQKKIQNSVKIEKIEILKNRLGRFKISTCFRRRNGFFGHIIIFLLKKRVLVPNPHFFSFWRKKSIFFGKKLEIQKMKKSK